MATYPLPGTSCTGDSPMVFRNQAVTMLPQDGRELVEKIDNTRWEWKLHWYISQWGGPTATLNGWCDGSMLVVEWRAPHMGDDVLLTTCLFKAGSETRFSTLTLEELKREAANIA